MTLLLTEIYWSNDLRQGCIVFAADRRISKDGRYEDTQEKIFPIPYLKAGVGYFGLAGVPTNRNFLSMRDWLTHFIRKNANLIDLQSFSNVLADSLNSDIPAKCKKKYISGFHIAGYNSSGLPEFWYVHNVQDDRVTITGTYEAREDFLSKHAYALGYDERTHARFNHVGSKYIVMEIYVHTVLFGKILTSHLVNYLKNLNSKDPRISKMLKNGLNLKWN